MPTSRELEFFHHSSLTYLLIIHPINNTINIPYQHTLLTTKSPNPSHPHFHLYPNTPYQHTRSHRTNIAWRKTTTTPEKLEFQSIQIFAFVDYGKTVQEGDIHHSPHQPSPRTLSTHRLHTPSHTTDTNIPE